MEVKQHLTNEHRPVSEPRSGLKREVELGSRGELDDPLLQVSTAGSPDSFFVAVSRTTVERVSCREHKLLRAGEVLSILTAIVLSVNIYHLL